jgi:hypothetical protein
MSRLNDPPDESIRCPVCNSALYRVYVITNGGVWLCESSEYLDWMVAERPDSESDRMAKINRASPLHCVIGSSGYTKDGTWPKDGFYCTKCSTICIVTTETKAGIDSDESMPR